MVLMSTGKVTVDVSEEKAEKLAAVLGYKYVKNEDDVVTDDLSDDFEVEPRPVVAPKRPGRPRKDAS